MTLIAVAGMLTLAMLTAHRIAGPYIALKQTFKAIKEGDLDCRLSFRGYDQLSEVEDAFNQLMNDLQRKIYEKEGGNPQLKTVAE